MRSEGRTAHGDMQTGYPNATLMARVEPRVEFVRTGPDGEDINSQIQVLTTTYVPEFCKMWLPGTDRSDAKQARLVKAVGTMYDENGVISHYEVLL